MIQKNKNNMIKYFQNNFRYDGRKLDEFRSLEIELNVSETAEGSARVKLGDTIVMAGVKLSVVQPFPDSPDEGVLAVNAELLPLSSPDFTTGAPDIQAIELARVIDRGFRESKLIDLNDLMIMEKEKVWAISVDICTINDNGNLLDASNLAALAALFTTKFPDYVDDNVDYKHKTDRMLKIRHLPIAITVYKAGDYFYLDPITQEEDYDARLTITSVEDGRLCALQKGGESPLSLNDIKIMTDMALKKADEIRKIFKEQVLNKLNRNLDN